MPTFWQAIMIGKVGQIGLVIRVHN